MRLDLVSIVESAYRPSPDHQPWQDGVASAVRPALDRGEGLIVFIVDASQAVPLPDLQRRSAPGRGCLGTCGTNPSGSVIALSRSRTTR